MNSRYSSLLVVIAISLLCVSLSLADEKSPRNFFIHDGDRIVFFGDSITDSEWYPTLLETFVLTRHPQWRNRFSNRGVSGDNSGSIARFKREVIAQEPDVLIYNMGFNDGGYDTLKSERLESWLANIEKTVALMREAKPSTRVMLASPIVNETSISADQRWVSHEVYPYTLLSFGHEEEKLARRLGTDFVDLGLLYGQNMGLGKVMAGASFGLSRDGVHPERVGQALIAFHLLRALGADAQLASLNIHAEKQAVISAKNCKIEQLNIADDIITIQRTCDSLPYPTPPEVRPISFLIHQDDLLNDDHLSITGATAPAYTLFIDDRRIAEIAVSELAEGVNLSRYPNTPMHEQALAVMQAVRVKQLAEIAFWRQFIGSEKSDGAGRPTEKATAEDRKQMEASQKNIADALAFCYSLNTPKTHTIRLVPSKAKIARYESLAAADINQSPLAMSVTPLEADWNKKMLLQNQVSVTIANPSKQERSGTLSWACMNGWNATPTEASFTVEPGKKSVVKFSFNAPAGEALTPAPEVTARWRWSNDWPYAMTIVRPLELTPRLGIAHATKKPGFSGNLDDWKDATTFVLNKVSDVNAAVLGNKFRWNGPSDLSGSFFIKWDESALYVAAMVHDDDHVQNANESMMWSQDSLMLGFLLREISKPDSRLEYVFAAYADRDAICPTSRDAQQGTGPAIQFKSHVNQQQGTCFYELAIPRNRLAPFEPANGKSFRMTLCVNDADSQPGKGFNYLSWTPGINYGKNPADFAWIILNAP